MLSISKNLFKTQICRNLIKGSNGSPLVSRFSSELNQDVEVL